MPIQKIKSLSTWIVTKHTFGLFTTNPFAKMATSTYVLYNYTPSLVGAVIFAALFVLSTAFHLYQRIRSHAKYFNPFIVGGICESMPSLSESFHWLIHVSISVQIIGYIARAAAHFNKTSVILYALQQLLILLAPILYAASIYMVLGRIITFLRGEHLSYVPVRLMTKIFVGGDVLSFILQGAGKQLIAGIFNTSETLKLTQ